jgi:hypothetical protein
MIMCQYLFAEFSLKHRTNEGLTEEQALGVSRWRQTLHGIAVEAILHLALVANLMAAIEPHRRSPGRIFRNNRATSLHRFNLSFCRLVSALLHFLYLEWPEGMERQDAEGFVQGAPR